MRARYNYYAKNKNWLTIDPTFVPKAYGLMSLWLGLRDERGGWELSISGRNFLNNKTVLSRGIDAGTLISPGRDGITTLAFAPTSQNNSGYRSISFVSRREFSLSFRYAFGSR